MATAITATATLTGGSAFAASFNYGPHGSDQSTFTEADMAYDGTKYSVVAQIESGIYDYFIYINCLMGQGYQTSVTGASSPDQHTGIVPYGGRIPGSFVVA